METKFVDLTESEQLEYANALVYQGRALRKAIRARAQAARRGTEIGLGAETLAEVLAKEDANIKRIGGMPVTPDCVRPVNRAEKEENT